MRKPFMLTAELLGCAALVGGLFYYSMGAFEPVRFNIPRHYMLPTMDDVDLALRRLHINPDTLAACGANAADAEAVIDAMHDALVADPALIASKVDDLTEARADYEWRARLVESGQATAQQISECQTYKTAVANAETALENVLDELFIDVIAGLTLNERIALTEIRDNGGWIMPTEFLVNDRTDQQWLQLRGALANERIAARFGEEPDPAEQQYLTTARTDPDVLLAKTNYDTNRVLIGNAWDQAMTE